MASLSDSRNTTSDETEVTSRQQTVEEDGGAASLERQSSIYSLTLDEIQNTVCGPGKPFGSMNMDEFLANIWTVEEANVTAAAAPPALRRQGSLTLPPPLSGKTVDEVWAEIHRGPPQPPQIIHPQPNHQQQPRAEQPTFGEMTLEDFLIKAGVVRESYSAAPTPLPPPPTPIPQQPFGYQIGGEAQGFGQAMGYGEHSHPHPHANGAYPVADGYVTANGKRGSDSGAAAVAAAAAAAGAADVGAGIWGAANGYGSPVSPVSDDGLGGGQVDNAGGLMDPGRMGRKRSADGVTVEKVVERRQRRMIKNRESAARSRARKQAYTVELEAELNQLKEENARLKEEERRAQALRKKMILDSMAERSRANAEKNARKLRRCNSVPW